MLYLKITRQFIFLYIMVCTFNNPKAESQQVAVKDTSTDCTSNKVKENFFSGDTDEEMKIYICHGIIYNYPHTWVVKKGDESFSVGWNPHITVNNIIGSTFDVIVSTVPGKWTHEGYNFDYSHQKYHCHPIKNKISSKGEDCLKNLPNMNENINGINNYNVLNFFGGVNCSKALDEAIKHCSLK